MLSVSSSPMFLCCSFAKLCPTLCDPKGCSTSTGFHGLHQQVELPSKLVCARSPFLENPMDGGAWWATVRRVAELDMIEEAKHIAQIILRNSNRPLKSFPQCHIAA